MAGHGWPSGLCEQQFARGKQMQVEFPSPTTITTAPPAAAPASAALQNKKNMPTAAATVAATAKSAPGIE